MGEVFLLGETDNSFDGRYFGITPASDIIGPLEALVIF
jgi:type IV secretory pathway protease TraF